MALDRWKLRDDLVAVIAAGRELAPENDYALAEIFLQHARESLLQEIAPPSPPVKRGQIATLVGAGCLALAALLSPFLFFHPHRDGGEYNQSGFVPGQFEPHHQFDRPNWWWNGSSMPHDPER